MALAKVKDTVRPGRTLEEYLAGFVEGVDDCSYHENRARAPYSLNMTHIGALVTQKMTTKKLLHTERLQDETMLAAHKDSLPVLLISGEHDAFFPPEPLIRHVRSEFVRAEAAVIKGSGHSPFWERSEETNELIARKKASALIP